jgi:cytochrome P450
MTRKGSTADLAPLPLPTRRSDPFDPPSELGRFREEEPIRPLAYPDGHVGWLVTSHALGRAVLGDPRFSIGLAKKRSPADQALREAFKRLASEENSILSSSTAGNFLEMDAPQHTRFRRLLAGEFTLRRMEALRPYLEQIVDDHLDAMAQAGPPVDLVESFALPIPSLAICELLGVPYSERDKFHQYSTAIDDPAATVDDIVAGYRAFDGLIRRVIAHELVQPGEGLLGRVIRSGELTEKELVGVGKLLVAAGHHTTKNMLALGTFTLLYDRRRWVALNADPQSMVATVEELLRYLTIFQIGAFTRTALEDLELGGVLISSGQSVTVSLSAANRDPERFDEPDVFDPTRPATGHLAFGHGVHMCLGQHLARIELQVGLAGLLRRFPTLRLAIPAEEVQMHPGDVGQAGVARLPVAW